MSQILRSYKYPMAKNHNPPAIKSQSVTCTYQQVIGCHAEVTKLSFRSYKATATIIQNENDDNLQETQLLKIPRNTNFERLSERERERERDFGVSKI